MNQSNPLNRPPSYALEMQARQDASIAQFNQRDIDQFFNQWSLAAPGEMARVPGDELAGNLEAQLREQMGICHSGGVRAFPVALGSAGMLAAGTVGVGALFGSGAGMANAYPQPSVPLDEEPLPTVDPWAWYDRNEEWLTFAASFVACSLAWWFTG